MGMREGQRWVAVEGEGGGGGVELAPALKKPHARSLEIPPRNLCELYLSLFFLLLLLLLSLSPPSPFFHHARAKNRNGVGS